MAFDKSGKYHMNPHHAKMADQGAGKPPMQASGDEKEMPGDADAGTEGQEPVMMTCPACGDTFPMEEGLAHNAMQQQNPASGHGAAPTHQSSGAPMAMSGY